MTAPSLFDERENNIEPARHVNSHIAPVAPEGQPDPTVSLYRKYRPRSFDADELVGQEHIVRTLRNAIALDRVAHAYLFCGPRGTGKTTTARLLAKAVNCLAADTSQRPCNACVSCLSITSGANPDIIEIDAASNRGIDDIRDLRERVRFAPAQLRSKVYIVDEAHQITGAAANAFLKTLEEPPTHTRFILATTDPEELLPTIVSRCQRFDFRRVNVEDMSRRLRQVSTREEIAIADDALRAIARYATGSVRDALGLLEQLILQAQSDKTRPIDGSDVQSLLGLSRNERVEALVDALARHSPGDALAVVQGAVDEGEDPRQLNRQLVGYLRLLMLERSGGAAEVDERGRGLAALFSLPVLASHARRFSEIDFTIKHAPYPQLPLEIALVEASLTAASGTSSAPAASIAADAADASAANIRPTSLRDRVRGQHPGPAGSPSELAPVARPQSATITPFPAASDDAPRDGQPADTREVNVDLIADLWPNVRADVKALNRRVEALLSEVDPVGVTGNHITLAVPYPFHRDKLNTDEVRDTVAGVLSRLLQQDVTVICVLRGEFNGTPQKPPLAPESQSPRMSETDNGVDAEEDERVRMRIQAAQNIFDAEEIEQVPAAGDAPASEES
jgi:DNA polymerase-3 subunit gamma/tau